MQSSSNGKRVLFSLSEVHLCVVGKVKYEPQAASFWVLRAVLNTSSCPFWLSPLPAHCILLAKGEKDAFHPLCPSVQNIACQGWTKICHYPKSKQDLLPPGLKEGFVWAFFQHVAGYIQTTADFFPKVLNFWAVNLIWALSYVYLEEIWWASTYEHLSFPFSPRILDNGLCAM